MILLLLLCIGGAVLLPNLLIQRFGFRNLTYSLSFSQEEVSEGDTVTLIETVCSRKLLPLPWVKAELTTDASLLFATDQSAVAEDTRFVSSFFCLYPYRKIERRWQVRCTKRGRFTVSHAVLVIADLFATLELSQPFPDACASLTVLPAVRDISALPEFPQHLNGTAVRDRMLIPDRFAICGIRAYRDGDSVRDLCRSASARTDEPMVWQYQETAAPSLTVLLNLATRDTDRDRVSDHAVYEEAIRLCAAYLGKAAAARIPVRFCANTQIDGLPAETAYATGEHAALRLLRVLAALPDQISERFDNLLRRVGTHDPAASILVITAQPDAALLRYAAAEPQMTVLSIRPLSQHITLPNVYHAPRQEHRR